ncbi:MAG: M20 family metallopeptidase [Hyphomicrobiales bacterium]
MADVNALKDRINAAIDGPLGDALVALSRDLHAHPETRFEEVHAMETITKLLTAHNIPSVKGVGGLPTAFEARRAHGNAGPTVAILAEYDALPGLGHACGHNVIAAAGVGAFLALGGLEPLPGVVRLIGTPAEEGGGGKVIMDEAQVFEGVDAAMMIHPFEETFPFVEFAGRVALTITFHGKSSHAGSAPEAGINALDAAILLFNGMNALRQRMIAGSRLHGIIAEGGEAPSIIPERSRVEVYVRAYDQAYLEKLLALVEACARGAAEQTGCRVEIADASPRCDSFLCSEPLAESFTANLQRIGHKPNPERFRAFASTDFGNVSQKIPSIHPYLGMGAGLKCHTHEFAAASGDARGDGIVREGAKALAMTALDALFDPALIERAKAAHARSQGTLKALVPS